MAKKWYISPIIGTGTADDPFRTKLMDLGATQRSFIPGKPDGTPKFNFGLSLVVSTDFTAPDADAQLNGFPGVALTDQLSTLSVGTRNAIQTALTNRGIDITGITLSNTVKDLLVLVLQNLGYPSSMADL